MKIMFVCTGNICRSAMADVMLKSKIKNTDLENKLEVFSAGTHADTGSHATFTAIEAMEELGIDLKPHRATNIMDSNIEDMDFILCATSKHKQLVLAIFPKLQDNVYTIKEFAEYDIESGLDISDPWGYDLSVYRSCASLLENCIDNIILKFQKKG